MWWWEFWLSCEYPIALSGARGPGDLLMYGVTISASAGRTGHGAAADHAGVHVWGLRVFMVRDVGLAGGCAPEGVGHPGGPGSAPRTRRETSSSPRVVCWAAHLGCCWLTGEWRCSPSPC